MELHVTFTGLCLFVPNKDEKRLHVLMPRTGHHGGHGHVEPHDVLLTYAGGPTNLPMQGWRLDLSGAGGTGTLLDLPDEILDVGALTKKQVDEPQWREHPRPTVVSRVTLPPAGRIDLGDRVRWKVDGTPRFLTHELTWIVPDAALDKVWWERSRLRPPSGHRPEPLPKPQPDAGGVVRLSISHVPPQDPIVCEGDEAEHVQAYYPVHREPLVSGPNPVLDEKSPDPRCPDGAGGAAPPGGSPFNCMLAQSVPE